MGEKVSEEDLKKLREFAEKETDRAIRAKEDKADLKHNNRVRR